MRLRESFGLDVTIIGFNIISFIVFKGFFFEEYFFCKFFYNNIYGFTDFTSNFWFLLFEKKLFE